MSNYNCPIHGPVADESMEVRIPAIGYSKRFCFRCYADMLERSRVCELQPVVEEGVIVCE